MSSPASTPSKPFINEMLSINRSVAPSLRRWTKCHRALPAEFRMRISSRIYKLFDTYLLRRAASASSRFQIQVQLPDCNPKRRQQESLSNIFTPRNEKNALLELHSLRVQGNSSWFTSGSDFQTRFLISCTSRSAHRRFRGNEIPHYHTSMHLLIRENSSDLFTQHVIQSV